MRKGKSRHQEFLVPRHSCFWLLSVGFKQMLYSMYSVGFKPELYSIQVILNLHNDTHHYIVIMLLTEVKFCISQHHH